ncbi:hypothetical protein P8936_15115 [Edaphobacter paludis]|uniref:Uncharacterized protein n=1 Tax=Edaphobacter paludis TaxID=3035702 RepID=A0AAU7D6Z1_9BACT
MSDLKTSTSNGAVSLTNGSGAAAVLAAGIGSFVLAILAIAADKITSIKGVMVFYKPTGPLSGVTTTAILFWLFTWGILEWRWRNKTVAARYTNTIALILLGLSLLLTFPPIGNLF